jgi:hypothetical protein
MNSDVFIQQSKPFVDWMLDWKMNLKQFSLSSLTQPDPASVGIVSVDVIEGFCTVGPLSSPRVNNIVEPITQLFKLAWEQGVRDIALPQDTHPADAVEFAQYGVHCVRGTAESETVAAFKALPFFDQLAIQEKNSINCICRMGEGASTYSSLDRGRRLYRHLYLPTGNVSAHVGQRKPTARDSDHSAG